MASQANQPDPRQRAGGTESSASPVASAHASRRVTGPPPKHRRDTGWLCLVPCLLLALPAMVIELQRPDSTDLLEARTIASAIETSRRIASSSASDLRLDRFVPYFNNRAQLSRPPGDVWLYVIGFRLADTFEPQSTVDDRVFQARLLSVLMALLAVACVFWIGHSIAGNKTAVFSSLVFAASPLLVYQARLATPTMPALAWTVLSVAAGLWAIRPLRPPPSVERQFFGWVVCGLAMGFATLTMGPRALLATAGTLLMILILCPNRLSHLMGLLAAVLIHVLMILPWIIHDAQTWNLVAAIVPNNWFSEMPEAGALGLRAMLVPVVLLPWTIWLISAVFQPFSTSSAGERTRLFLAWSWLIVMLTLLFSFTQPDMSHFLLILPAASVLVGHLFQRYNDLSSEARYPRSWRFARWLHLSMLFVLSIAIAVLAHFQPELVDRGMLAQQLTGSPGWWYWLGLSLVLLAIWVLALHWSVRHYPARALICFALWSIVLMVVTIIPLSRGSWAINPHRRLAGRIQLEAFGKPVFFREHPSQPGRLLDPSFVLYAGRPIPPITVEQFNSAVQMQEEFYLLSYDEQHGYSFFAISNLPAESQGSSPSSPPNDVNPPEVP